MGYTLEEIQDTLRGNCGIEGLSYLSELQWMPSTTSGEAEFLHFGIRDNAKVFASFNENRGLQVIIFEHSLAGEERRISIKDMQSKPVTLLQPFSYWTSQVKDAKVAQKLRVYLKGCFALRGHTGDSLVSFDLQEFTRIVSTIELARVIEGRARRVAYERPQAYTVEPKTAASDFPPEFPDPSEDVIPIIDDTGSASDTYATSRTYASIYSTSSPGIAREPVSGPTHAMEHEVIDLSDDVTDSMYGRNNANRDRDLRRSAAPSTSSEAPMSDNPNRGTAKTVALQDQAPANDLTYDPNVDPVKISTNIASTARNRYGADVASSERHKFPTQTSDMMGNPTETSSQTSVQQRYSAPVQTRPCAYPYPPLMPADTRAVNAYSMTISPLTATQGLDKHIAGLSRNGLEVLTPASKAYLDNLLCVPNPETCHEYCTNLNLITAATPRIASYHEKIAQHRNDIAELKARIDSAVATADIQQLKIMEEHAKSSQAALASSEISSLDARIAAIDASTEQAKKDREMVKATLAKETEPLKLQIKNLEDATEAERKTASQLWEETNNAKKRKREIEASVGGPWAFFIDKEAAAAMKRQRGE